MSPPTLTLSPRRLAEIRALALRAHPEECCGVLLGHGPSSEAPARVAEIVPTPNAEDAARRRIGYRIEAARLLAAHRRGRERGLEIVGFYHSHPERTAAPSRRDHREAWPDVSYLIVAVHADGRSEARSWRLTGERGRLVEERLLIGAGSTFAPLPRRYPGDPA